MQALTRNNRMSRRTRGFTLVELLVSVAISFMLLMGVVALFVSSRASYETTERLSRIQENGRFALDQIVNDIRSSGFQGCARSSVSPSRAGDFRITTLRAPTDMRWNFAVPAQGFNGTGSAWTPTLDITNFNPAPSGTGDVLVLRIPRRDARAVQLTTKQTDPADPLTVGVINPAPLAAGDTAMVNDCTARAFFQVTGYAGGQVLHADIAAGATTPGNNGGSLLHPFMAGAEVLPVSTMIYYLARSENDNTRMSLWRKSGGTALSDELAEGIERFEVQYGVDTSGDGRIDDYVTAAAVTNWDRVMTVQIAVLARSPDAYGTDLDTQAYTLFSTPVLLQTVPANDRFQRKVFTATVAVRNQIID